MGKFERQVAHQLHRGSGSSMYTRKAHATRETPTRDRDDQPDAREGQAAADAGPRDGYGQMRFAGAGSADQHGVALLDDEAAGREIADQRLVDRRAGEVEVVDVLGQRQLGDGQLVLDRARLLLGDLGAQEIADDARRLAAALVAITSS